MSRVHPVRIVLVDDHAAVRGGIRRLLDDGDGFEVVGEAGTVEEALSTCERERPDAVVLDVALGERSGLEIIPDLVGMGARVVILTMHDGTAYARLAFERGATAYVLKDAADAELMLAIDDAMQGRRYVRGAVAARLAARDVADDLTARERDVLRAIALGYTNVEVAGQLHLSVPTIEAHRGHIAAKLRLGTRAELVRYARRKGLLDLGAAS